jgi:holo-[acyl-carrier protein] synthase
VIQGIGLDLVAVARIRAAHGRHGDRFLERFLTTAERSYCLDHRDPAERIAGRWAAKEAAVKALGTGMSDGVGLLQVEILPGPAGAPALVFHGAAAARAAARGITRTLVTITHSDGMAAAMVVLE